MADILENFEWHSSLGIDSAVEKRRRVGRLPNTAKVRMAFQLAGENLLIHRSKRALWKVSDDGKFIEPVFPNDVLEEGDVEK